MYDLANDSHFSNSAVILTYLYDKETESEFGLHFFYTRTIIKCVKISSVCVVMLD